MKPADGVEGPTELVDVVVPIAVRHPFTYRLPATLRGNANALRGRRVVVPFRTGTVIGYLVGLHNGPFEGEAKELREILDPEPLLGEKEWKTAEWMAGYYVRSLGETLDLFLPSALRGGWKKGSGRRSARPSKTPDELRLQPVDIPRELTPEQRSALDRILPCVRGPSFRPVLLHGITGSGKTAVYVELARAAAAEGRGSIVLVPEIGLTSHVARHFLAAFEGRVALLHSRLTPRQRWDEWERIRSRQADIVVGPRSALFAPLAKLGLIVVDEEHDGAYKQDDGVTYHGRDVALVIGRERGIPVVLGSATPCLESYAHARSGKYEHIRLARRVGDRPLPEMSVVDMRVHRNPDRALAWLSPQLRVAMEDTLGRGGQVVLFLNRRGFAPVLRCEDCGTGTQCPHCDVAMTFHKVDRLMHCHYCDRRQDPPQVCSKCGGANVALIGAGTQKLEEDLRRLFPASGIARLDTDTAQKKGRRFEILRGLETGALQIAVGTQMITKGHHYPQITLVGVVDADLGLRWPDFRAAERTYQQILQAAGRAGRGEQRGRVIVQTMSPEHHAIRAASAYDEERFYAQELRFRRQFGYPPFARLALLRIQAADEARGSEAALETAQRAGDPARRHGVEILGPAPAPLYRLRRFYRWHILLKASGSKNLHALLDELLDARGPRRTGFEVRLDLDPVNML